jgi:LAS superfamily LD-carboxypeptidase LdcB
MRDDMTPNRKMAAACAFVILAGCAKGECRQTKTADVYAGIDSRKYLTGKYLPSAHPAFVELAGFGIPTDGKPQYLRREAAEMLQRLFRDFHSAHPGVSFRVRSSTRTWSDQKAIWEDKWRGITRVEGKKLNIAHKEPLERARIILRYSSMPGTSRHHWGTDFDLNELNNEYFEKGNGAVLFDWMSRNASRYGFCRPYAEGRNAGYEEERWHWSYTPLAARFLHDWISMFSARVELLYRDEGFAGAGEAGRLAPVYVESVSDPCR